MVETSSVAPHEREYKMKGKESNTIDFDLIKGCDHESGVYCRMYNRLQPFLEVIDEGTFDELDDIDLSAFGLYLCKFIEQELNSSVIQLCREYIGIRFPECFCSVDPTVDRNDAVVNTATYGNKAHYVYLNDHLDKEHHDVLKMIPMGEALNVLRTLLKEDREWFADFPFLKNERFIELWRDISKLRNSIAHPGSIIGRDILLECYQKCGSLIKEFLPSMIELKEELMPENWKGVQTETTTIIGDKKINRPSIDELMARFKPTGLPKATAKDYEHYQLLTTLLNKARGSDAESGILDELSRLTREYDWYDTLFMENGKIGSKDICGNVVVPAEYDDVVTIHNILVPIDGGTMIVQKNGKYGFVKNYTGKVLGVIEYDSLQDLDGNFMLFQKNGTDCHGIVNRWSGREVVPCIMDNISEIGGGIQNYIFRSGDKYGIYSRYHDVYLEPVFDDIIEADKENEPFIFVLDDVKGYMSRYGKFYTCEEYDSMQNDDDYQGEFVEPLDFFFDCDDSYML